MCTVGPCGTPLSFKEHNYMVVRLMKVALYVWLTGRCWYHCFPIACCMLPKGPTDRDHIIVVPGAINW